MRLTVRSVETLRPSTDRREIPDDYMAGLYCVLQPSGAKSWAVRYRHQGVSRKLTLGSYPALGLKDARELASKALRTVAEGRDPGREKILARAAKADSVDRVVEDFLERHVRRSNRPKTAKETERLLRKHILPVWQGRMMHEVTRRDVLDVLDRIVDAGAPVVANRVLAVVRKLFNWAISRDIIASSPCAGVKPPSPETARARTLSDGELTLVWKAAGGIGYPFGTLVQLLAATGQRRDEVARMRWEEVHIEGQLWTLPAARAKNNKPHEVPLSDIALDILKAVPRVAGSHFVLTNNSGASPASGYSRGKDRIDALLPAAMSPWRLHDLRRTCASGMARLGINLPVVEKCLNHVSGSFRGIVGVYQHQSFADEKRAALQAWGQHIDALVSGKPASKVVRLREKRS